MSCITNNDFGIFHKSNNISTQWLETLSIGELSLLCWLVSISEQQRQERKTLNLDRDTRGKLVFSSLYLMTLSHLHVITETYHEIKASFDLSCPLCSNSTSQAAYRHSGCCSSAVFMSSYVASRKEQIIRTKCNTISHKSKAIYITIMTQAHLTQSFIILVKSAVEKHHNRVVWLLRNP